MATLRLILGSDPRALLEAAADGFLAPAGRGPGDTAEGPAADPFPTPRYLLALRQGGLRDDVLALAASRGVPGWFEPPLCLFQQLGEWLGATAQVPCGDYERVVLLSRLLREHAPAVFARLARPDAFVDAVDRLFGELAAEGVGSAAFAAALVARGDRDPFEAGRDADLSACYAAYAAALDGAGRRDGRDRLIDCAAALRADPEGFAARMGGRREVRIFGLQDLRGGWSVLLRALRESPALDAVSVWSAVSADAFAGLAPDSIERRDGNGGLASRLFAGDAADGARAGLAVCIVSAPDADRETEDVARRVRARIDEGADPSAIAVVSRSARPYVDRVLAALDKYGVPATARRRHAFAEIPVVRALLSLFAVAAEGWTRHGLVELAEQPYFGRNSRGSAPVRRLDPLVLNHIGYRERVVGLDAWIRAHETLRDRVTALEARIAAGEEERWGRDTPPSSARVGEAHTFFRRFAEQARELERARPFREWVEWLSGFLETDPWKIESHVYRVPEDRYDVARLDAAGLAGMREILGQWREALGTWGGGEEVLEVAGFESRLREMLAGDAALWTPTRRAVQVGEGLAAAQRSFDHVFIVGLAGDAFPLRAPRSPVLDDEARTQLAAAGLPLEVRETWERRERELFRVLVAGAARSLTLSAPRSDDHGRELAPSAFLEEAELAAGAHAAHEVLDGSLVVSPSLPLVTQDEVREHAVHAAEIERDRRSGRLSAHNGLIEAPDLREWLAAHLGEAYVWSPTQLESSAKCPWAWFSQRLLRLEHLEDPDIDIDPIARGTILHDAMRRFYGTAGVIVNGPVLLRAAHLVWARPLLEQVLDEAIAESGSDAWLGVPALRRTKREELRRMLVRYLEWEVQHNEDMYNARKRNNPRILRTGVVEHELVFGMTGAAPSHEDVVIERAGTRYRLRGSVDRVERGVDERIQEGERGRYIAAVDYKTSLWSTPGGGKPAAWTDGVVLQVPLYAHVLQRMRSGSRVARVEYRAFKQTGVQHSLELVRIDKATHAQVEDADAAARLERALDDAARTVRSARAGEFPAHPAPSCACPPFCHGWDICRVAMGPRSGRDVDAAWERAAAAIRGTVATVADGEEEEE